MSITEEDIQTEAARIRNQEQYAKEYHQYDTPDALKNKFVPKTDEHYRSTALLTLQNIQARNAREARQDILMWDSRNENAARRYAAEQAAAAEAEAAEQAAAAKQAGKKGGYRKSRRSRTLKRVQKRKQTRRHRHRHRHRR
jgi:hypothetical protein